MADEIDRIIDELASMERERLTGWQGPGGAAYNAVSEALCEAGLLTQRWNISPLGQRVRARLLEREGG